MAAKQKPYSFVTPVSKGKMKNSFHQMEKPDNELESCKL